METIADIYSWRFTIALAVLSFSVLALAFISVDKKTIQCVVYHFKSIGISKRCKHLVIDVINNLGTFYTGKQKHYLKHFNYGNPDKEIIIGVAIKTNGDIINAILGMHKHADIILYLNLKNKIYNADCDTCGFLTSNGRFVDRTEAKEIAIKNNQLIQECGKFKELISEELKNAYWQ